MRLIDADKLIKSIEHSRNNNPHKNCHFKRKHEIEHLNFMKMVADQPTAFDKEKVIEELRSEIHLTVYDPMISGRYIKKERAIKIIEKGGCE